MGPQRPDFVHPEFNGQAKTQGDPRAHSGALYPERNALPGGLCPVNSSHLSLQDPFSCLRKVLSITHCILSLPVSAIFSSWGSSCRYLRALQRVEFCYIFSESLSLCFSLSMPCWPGFWFPNAFFCTLKSPLRPPNKSFISVNTFSVLTFLFNSSL